MHLSGNSVHTALPPLPWLRAFEASARHLSFTQAAGELHLTQAAISKQVKSLELYLGQPLFVRHPRSLALTRTGEAYLPKVADAFGRLALGTREVFGRRRNLGLTVRCAVSFAVEWLAPRLPGFLALHPGVEVRVLSSVWADAADPDLVDLDIQYGSGAWPGVTSHRLTWEKITPLCAPGLGQSVPNQPFTGQSFSGQPLLALRDPADLRTHRLLHVLGYREGWGVWLRAAAARGVDPGQGVQLDTSLAAFALAQAGGGVALGRTSLAAGARAAGRLIAPFALEVPIAEAFHLLVPTAPDPHPDAARFTDWLLSLRQNPHGTGPA